MSVIEKVQGRRLPVIDGKATYPEQPGDYCGPVRSGDVEAIFFLKPNARDADAPPRAKSVQHVAAPPHSFIEEPDGSLTISPSISEFPAGGGASDGWHGYLECGKWRKV